MRKVILSLCIASFVMSGCATPTTMSPQGSKAEIDREARIQKEMAFKRVLEEEERVREVSYPIFIANASLCTETALSLGMNAWNEHTLSGEYKDVGNILYGLGEVLQVQAVYTGTPAARADMQAGDKIIAINDEEISSGRNAISQLQKALAEAEDPEVKITLSRKGREFSQNVERARVCKYGISYDYESMDVNAYADGKFIYITRGMLRFVDNDTELALVIAHELAHNAMGHVKKQKTNAMGAGLGGFAIDILAAAAGVNTQGAFTDAAMKAGAKAYSVEFEQEADYVGMYFMKRAGYRVDGVANFWRRMAAENSAGGIKRRTTHPATAERFVAINKAYEEIQKKKLSKLELKPEIDQEKSSRQVQQSEPRAFND